MNKTPKLRFKEFSGDWESKKLGTVCDIVMGQSPSSSNYNEEKIGLPLIQGNADVKDRKTSPRIYTSEITKTCNIGDIIMSVRAPVGAISKSEHEACIGRGVCSITPNQNSEFVYQYLLGYEPKWSKVSQGSTFEAVNRTDIFNTKIVLPSLEEQEKIASFFSLIDKKISLQSEKVEMLKEYKKGMMQKIFSRELRFKDNSGRDYPEWEEKKIKDIFTVTRGVVIAKTEISDVKSSENQYPVYSSQTSNNGILGYDSKYDFEGKYLTWTTDGANAGKVFARAGKFRCTNVCGVLVEKENTLGFANKMISEILNKETPKHVSYVGNPKLMNGVMSDIKIKIPTIEEQMKIAKVLDVIDLKIDKEEEKLDYLNQYKQGLLQQMFV